MPMEVHSMIPKEFGPRLKISRRQKHLNQTDISKRLNITRQAYSNYETGRCAPPVDVLAELTLLLEYDFFSIFLEAAASKLFHSNFQFYPECGGSSGKNPTNWSSYLLTDIIHPHGIQEIPRSILFGIDMDVYDKGRSKEKRFVKSYWAQYDIKYQSYFEEAELFIIFGMSLSITDGWWLDQIFDAI